MFVIRQTRVIGQLQGSRGFIATPGGGPALRGIVLNGTSQNGHRTLPNTAPFTSLGAFQMVFRVRNPGSTAGAYLFEVRNSAETPQFYITMASGGLQWGLVDVRDGSIQTALTPNTMSDSVYKLQYDPANTRWTFESWDTSGSNRVQATLTITTTTGWALGSGLFTLGSNFFDGSFLALKCDWFRWSDNVEALNSGRPAEIAPVGPAYHAKWEFENDGVDSAASAGNLTLGGAPSFEDTP